MFKSMVFVCGRKLGSDIKSLKLRNHCTSMVKLPMFRICDAEIASYTTIKGGLTPADFSSSLPNLHPGLAH